MYSLAQLKPTGHPLLQSRTQIFFLPCFELDHCRVHDVQKKNEKKRMGQHRFKSTHRPLSNEENNCQRKFFRFPERNKNTTARTSLGPHLVQDTESTLTASDGITAFDDVASPAIAAPVFDTAQRDRWWCRRSGRSRRRSRHAEKWRIPYRLLLSRANKPKAVSQCLLVGRFDRLRSDQAARSFSLRTCVPGKCWLVQLGPCAASLYSGPTKRY